MSVDESDRLLELDDEVADLTKRAEAAEAEVVGLHAEVAQLSGVVERLKLRAMPPDPNTLISPSSPPPPAPPDPPRRGGGTRGGA